MSDDAKRPAYEWPEGYKSAAAFTVDVDADVPYRWQHRDAMPPTLGQLEQRRFGPRQGLWRLVGLIEQNGIKGSFYVPGLVAETHPDLLPELLDRGHEIGLHGYFHEIVAESDDAEFARALDKSLALFERQTGKPPVGFRSPAWEMTRPMLARLKEVGLAYDSSLMGFDHPYEIDGVVEIPVQWLLDDAIYFKFVGGGNDSGPPVSPAAVLESWRMEFDGLHRFGGLFMLTVHDWISGRGQRIMMLERLLGHIASAGSTWWATASEIATWHRQSPNLGRFQVEGDIPAAIGPRRAEPA
ncbi:MAG: polysaccharide deacetylase [Pseudomonadota bacterium]